MRKQPAYEVKILRRRGFLYCDVKEVASGLPKVASEKGLHPGWVITDSKTSVDSLLANRLYTQQIRGLETTENIIIIRDDISVAQATSEKSHYKTTVLRY